VKLFERVSVSLEGESILEELFSMGQGGKTHTKKKEKKKPPTPAPVHTQTP